MNIMFDLTLLIGAKFKIQFFKKNLQKLRMGSDEYDKAWKSMTAVTSLQNSNH